MLGFYRVNKNLNRINRLYFSSIVAGFDSIYAQQKPGFTWLTNNSRTAIIYTYNNATEQ